MPPSDNDVVMEKNHEKEVMPFMDTFYSLASNDPSERKFAASSLIHHVFSSEEGAFDVTVKDGSYAMTRLLMGVCSGRASARQGMASCLATFLRISFQMGPEDGSERQWIQCFMEHMVARSKESSLAFVRRKLIESTSLEAPKGKTIMKKSRADERDAHFGRLFGILAIARSGILNDKNICLDTYKSFVSDLVQLFHHKKWFREPAVHAMNEFFTSIALGASNDVLRDLVEMSLSKFFSEGVWSSEKIALYLLLQVLLKDSLPTIISKPLLTASNLSSNLGDDKMSVLLRDTSSTVYPRVHIVWKAIWSYTCEPTSNKHSESNLILRTKLPVGDESSSDIIEAIVQNVIIEQLLGNNTDGGINATHERRALALSLVHQMFKIQLPIHVIESTVLHPTVVTQLFVHTLQKVTGNKGGEKNAPMHHTLQPLARRILEDITDTFAAEKLDATSISRRLCIVKALLRANVSFDSVTQTQTVSSLIGLENESSVEYFQLWDEYSNILILATVQCFKSNDPSFSEANKYIDMLYSFAKRMHKASGADALSRKVLLFFLIGAFFDLSGYKCTTKSAGNSLIEVANMIAISVSTFPFEIRVTMSSRFFSLLSECCTIVAADKSDNIRDKKIETINSNLEGMFQAIVDMEKYHASLICQKDATSDDRPISRAIKIYKDIIEKNESFATDEYRTNSPLSAFVALSSSLCIQLLNPGEPNEDDEEFGDDEEDITDDILDILSDITDVVNGITGINEKIDEVVDDEIEEEDAQTSSNLLVSLATISVSLLNSSIGGSTTTYSVIRGGGSKLVRDTISLVWSCALNMAGTDAVGNLSLDAEVVNVLLASVCSEKVLAQGEEEIDEDDEIDGDYDESDEDSDEDISLSFSKLAPDAIDDESGSESDANSIEDIAIEEQVSNNKEKEEEIDSSRLENLLLQDSDDDDNDENILEHHEGADAALAQLIKLKQDARKGAQEKREKAELSNRLRCFSLLEAIYSSNRRTSLLSNQAVLMPILPLLRSRTELHKSINSLSIEKKGSSIAEKRSLMEKITSLIENKICKVHLDGTANIEGCKVLADQVIVEMKRAQNMDHSKCCSAILILINKAVSKHRTDAIQFAKGIYDECLLEWSTKKTTRLQTQMFEDLINKSQTLAHIILPAPLVSASKNARSSFLQAEAFRLLSLLYQKPSSDYGSEELQSLQTTVPAFIESLIVAFKDDALGKSKRVRELIKATERLLSFVLAYSTENVIDKMRDLNDSIKEYELHCSSTAITNTCAKLREEMEKQVQKSKNTLDAKDEVGYDQEKSNSKKAKKQKKSDKKKKKSKK